MGLFKRSNIWYVDFRANGKRIRKKAGKSQELARKLLNDYELQVQRGQLGFLDRKEVLLEKFVEEFIAHSQANHREPTTVRYRSTLANFLTFCKAKTKVKNLSDVTPAIVEQYKSWRKTTPIAKNGSKSKNLKLGTLKKGAKDSTLNFEIQTLKTMFNLAVKWKRLEESPMTVVKMRKVEDAEERRFLSEGECRLILEESNPQLYSIFFTFMNTGMRRAELVNLEWDDVDFEDAIIRIRHKSFWKPKTGKREIPINPDLQLVLNKLPKKGNFVFADKFGERLNADWVREQLVKVAKKAGVRNLTSIHAFRHTFASQLIRQKVDVPTVQKLLGHSDIETTMKYAHQTTDQLRDAVKTLQLAPKPDKEKIVKIG